MKKNNYKLFYNFKTLLSDPAILPLYFLWIWSILRGGDRYCVIRGSKIAGFPNFSSYLGAVRNALTVEELEFVSPYLKNAKVIFDVGANFGAFVIPLAKLAKATQFFAFEPNPRTANALRRNITLNQVANVTVVEAALADADGQIVFSDTDDPATNHILQDGENGLIVNARSLASVCDEYSIARIDFLKIDVEGAEMSVLNGADEKFSDGTIGAGMIEICPGNLRKFGRTVSEITKFFHTRGFDIFVLGVEKGGEITDKLRLENAGFLRRSPLKNRN
jgi:FkbM family methyltransferase